jgi:hypothetical protein
MTARGAMPAHARCGMRHTPRGMPHQRQTARMPPSITSSAAVTKRLSSDAR